MANIINNNFHNVKIKFNKEDYWDFYINQDDNVSYSFSDDSFYKNNLISYIDFSSPECILMDDVNGLSDYVWDGAYTNNAVLNNIGYTGFDNGLIQFRRDKIDNKKFLELYQNTQYELGDELVLKLHPVSGCTNLYEYPFKVFECDVELNGGFFQGFFKTKCGEYEVLPTKLNNGETWSYEFVLKPSNLQQESKKTLNEKYPNNKGIFFYIGTRSENKWAYLYNKEEDESTYLEDYIEGGKIDVRKHKLTAFTDIEYVENIPIEYEAVAMDDYLSFKYYDEKKYEETTIFDDYIDDEIFENKPLIIDEENSDYQNLYWCCNTNGEYDYNIRQNYCNCSSLKQDLNNSCNCMYFSKCEIFGDNYVSDLDDYDDGIVYVENDLDISDFQYYTDNDILVDKNQYYIESDNKFLMFDRTPNGYNVKNWEEGNIIRFIGTKSSFKDNLFLLMNRTPSGHTIHTINELKKKNMQEYNIVEDLYNNALAFRITDNGAIGYKYLVLDCETDEKYKILEEYSKDNIVINEEWNVIHVKIESNFGKMKILFYVNGNLVFISQELPLINLRKLNEVDSKQESVAYNISLGGGTQGLIDVILPNYMIDPYRKYPLEKHFAGTFIGRLKSFKMYNNNLELFDILNNFNYEMNNLKNN